MLMNGLGAWVGFDAFDVIDPLLTQPILIIAGSEAGSLWHGEELLAKAQGPKELFIIEGDTNRKQRCALRSDNTHGTSLVANQYRDWTCEKESSLLLGLDSRGLHLKPWVCRIVNK
jgi:hypothetical protein